MFYNQFIFSLHSKHSQYSSNHCSALIRQVLSLLPDFVFRLCIVGYDQETALHLLVRKQSLSGAASLGSYNLIPS